MKEKLSVCLGVHNGETFLREQIDSILPQLGADDEIVCSDDNSTDMSRSILESYKDPRVKVLESPAGNNHVKNFEHALRNCSGELIFLSDQDDMWEANKVASLRQQLNLYDLVLTDCSVIDDHGRMIHDSFFELHSSGKGMVRNIIRNSYMGCCMAFRRKVIEKALPFPDDITAHDQWIGLIAEKYFKVKFIPAALVRYRRHALNHSSTTGKSTRPFSTRLMERYILMKNLRAR